MNTFIEQMQILLIRKEQQFDKLKHVSSRATKDTSYFIDELIKDIAETIKKYLVDDPEENDSDTPLPYQCYRCFLLNTHFSSQQYFRSIQLYGHLINIWPFLSPYLFIQIIWKLNYEEILINSILHIPLDLCMEVIEIAIKCVADLDVDRAVDFLINMSEKIYLRCLQLHWRTLSMKSLKENAYQLVAYFQTALDLISKFIRFPEKSESQRYLRHGYALDTILLTVQHCFERKKIINGMLHNTYIPYNIFGEDVIDITYGIRTFQECYYYKLQADQVHSIMKILDQEWITLLLKQVKSINYDEYKAWAKINYKIAVLTLQKAIVIQCRLFMQYMKQSDFLRTNNCLHYYLQQVINLEKSSFSLKSVLTIQNLCHRIDNGKPEEMKELLERYKEWDQATLEFISKKTLLLKKYDSSILLEYLHHIFECSNVRMLHTESEKNQAYKTILKIMEQQELSLVYTNILKYTKQHYMDNHLKYIYNQENFVVFISSNESMCDHWRLRILLIYILLNAEEVLTFLLKLVICNLEDQHIFFTSSHLLLLRYFFTVTVNPQHTVLTHILQKIFLKNQNLNFIKFNEVLEVMTNHQLIYNIIYKLDHKQIIKMDDLINNVYIPYINETSFNYHFLMNVLVLVYQVLQKGLYTCKMNITLLIIALVKRMKRIRRYNPQYARIKVAKTISYITQILCTLFRIPHWLVINPKQQFEMLKAIEDYIEPYDQIILGPLWNVKPSILDVIQEYEKQCSVIYHDFCMESKLQEYVHSFQLDQEAYIRHILLYASENVNNFMIKITTMYWSHFGWANPFEAYENMLRIIAETAQFAFMYDFIFPSDTFIDLLLKSVTHSQNFMKIYHCNIENVSHILLKTVYSVHLQAITKPHYNFICHNLLLRIMDMCLGLNSNLDYFRQMIDLFEEHLEIFVTSPNLLQSNISIANTEQNTKFMSDFLVDENLKKMYWVLEDNKIINIFRTYYFVRECMKIPNTKFSAESYFDKQKSLSKRNQISLNMCKK